MPIHRTEMKLFTTTHSKTKSILAYPGKKSSSIPHTEIKSIFNHLHKMQVNLHAHTKASDFRPTFKDQVIFDHPHDKQINSIPTLKSSHTRSPALKSR